MSEPRQFNKAFAYEVGVPIVLVVLASAFLIDSRNISGATFDALGPAPIPRLICWCVMALCLVIIGQTWLAHKRVLTAVDEKSEDLPKPQPVLAMATLALTAVYVVSMAFRMTSFAVATIVYLSLTIGILCRFSKRGMMVAGGIAVIMGFGCQYLFTEIFVIDLPTGVE